jgi:hypothetical protein
MHFHITTIGRCSRVPVVAPALTLPQPGIAAESPSVLDLSSGRLSPVTIPPLCHANHL